MTASTMPPTNSNILTEKAASKNNRKSARPKRPAQAPIKCPECGSSKIWKDGLRYTGVKPIQRWLCRTCGFRFSESTFKLQVKVHVSAQPVKILSSVHDHFEPSGPLTSAKKSFNNSSLPLGENVSSHVNPHKVSATATFKNNGLHNRYRRVCVSEVEAKNLAESETRQEEPVREGTTQAAEIKGKIVEFLWHLKKQGLSDNTIANYKRRLHLMIRAGVNLFNPEDVKEYLAKSSNSNGTKVNDICAYGSFLKFLKISWEPPIYKHEGKIPFIPTEKEIDQLIAASGRKVSVVLQLLKETGMRIGEAMRLKWTDIDFERRTVRITPEKHSNPRIIPVSNKLLEMLSSLPKNSEKIFPNTRKAMDSNFYKQRRRIARKLGNPRLLQIGFHTLRHWKGTMEYHKTKDPEYVKRLLGHRRMDSTMLYINIEQAIFQSTQPDEFHIKVAQTTEEIKTLLETGFEYVLQKDGLAFFRKRK